MRYRLFFLAAFLISCGVCVPSSVHAALLYIDPQSSDVFRGDTITLAVRLDTDPEECVNTVDATITYSPNITAVDISRGDSILSLWVEEPVIDETNHTIKFAGGIPGGYCGRIPGDPKLTNVIAQLVMRAPGLSIGGGSNPVANVNFDGVSQVLLNDGLGTVAPLTFQGAEIHLASTPGTSVEDDWTEQVSADDIPPAEFDITLARDEYAFSGKQYIVFNSIDKQSGIDHYEVLEEPFEDFNLFSWGAVTAPWTTASSPYVLKDQTLNSTIHVKAIDKAGNETLSILVPDTAVRKVSTQRLIAISVLASFGVIVVAIVWYALWRRSREKGKVVDTK